MQRLAYRRRLQYPPKPCGAQVRGWGAGVKFRPLCAAQDPPLAQERWACDNCEGCYKVHIDDPRGVLGPAGLGPGSAAETCTRILCGTQTKGGELGLCPCSHSVCTSCVSDGGDLACLPQCGVCGSACTSCISDGSGKACASLCCTGPDLCRGCLTPGYAMSAELDGACVPCPAGHYGVPAVRDGDELLVTSPAECRVCPAGSYCPGGSAALPCPAGSYCPAKAANATTCPAGSYCPANAANPHHLPSQVILPRGQRRAHRLPRGVILPGEGG